MKRVDTNLVSVALDTLLRARPKGGQRSRVLELGRDVLLPVCEDLINPAIPQKHTFERLRMTLGEDCPGKDALYRFAAAFMKRYRFVAGEDDGARLSPMVAALPVHEVANRLCLPIPQVQALIDEGRLHAVDLDGQCRVPMESLRNLLAEGEGRSNGLQPTCEGSCFQAKPVVRACSTRWVVF